MALTRLERRSRIKMRIRKDICGTKDVPRLSVFRSNKGIYVHLLTTTRAKPCYRFPHAIKKLRGRQGSIKQNRLNWLVNWLPKNQKAVASWQWFSTGMVIYTTAGLRLWLKRYEKVDLNSNKLCQT